MHGSDIKWNSDSEVRELKGALGRKWTKKDGQDLKESDEHPGEEGSVI